jgi:thymidine phosphorylase
VAKAGFDLQQDVSADLRLDEITIRMPHASILGVEQKQTEVLAFENGFWNRISAADLQSELAALPELARQKALESGILAEAEAALQKQLKERVDAGRPVHLLFQNTPGKD